MRLHVVDISGDLAQGGVSSCTRIDQMRRLYLRDTGVCWRDGAPGLQQRPSRCEVSRCHPVPILKIEADRLNDQEQCKCRCKYKGSAPLGAATREERNLEAAEEPWLVRKEEIWTPSSTLRS